MKRICVFCGSSPGKLPSYTAAAKKLGKLLAKKKIGLVYGGASIGLMGAIADSVLAAGGDVIGVIPKDLAAKEVAHKRLPDLRIVSSMHERKALMEKLSDGFIALPGGYGTFEEFCEILTWSQLGLHKKPCGLLNISGYYDRFLEFIDHAVREEFVRKEHRDTLLCASDPEQLLLQFQNYAPPMQEKWITSTSKT